METIDPYRHKWWALTGVCILAFTAFLDATIVNTALPFIQIDLKASILQLQWIANLYTVILGMTMIGIGKCAALWGKKKIYYSGTCLFACAIIGAALSPNIQWLIFFRAIQSVGASVLFIISGSALSEIVPEKDRVKAISLWGGCTGFGLAIGPFIGGILLALLSWRWVFWINLPLIALGLACCLYGWRTSEHKLSVKIDFQGLFLLIFGLGSLLYGIITAAQSDWNSYPAIALLIVGALAVLFLLYVDRRKQASLLHLEIFQHSTLQLVALSSALSGIIVGVFLFFDPLYLKIGRDATPFWIGLMIAIIPIAQVLTSACFHHLLKWFNASSLLLFSCAAALIGFSMHLFFRETTSFIWVAIAFFLLGINWALSNVLMVHTAAKELPAHQNAQAIGTLCTLWNVMAALFLALSSALFHTLEKTSSFIPAMQGAFLFNTLFALVLFLYALCIRSRSKSFD